MKKQLVKELLLVMLVLTTISSAILLARNIELTSKLDESEALLIEMNNEMFDMMSDEYLAEIYLSEEHGINGCNIELGDEDYDEMVEIMAFDDDGEIVHCGSFNRDWYRNKYKLQ